MPFPVSADRLSPSGTFHPLAGCIAQLSTDQTRELVQIPEFIIADPGVTPVPLLPRDASGDPIAAPLVNFTPGNGILIWWHLQCWNLEDSGDTFFGTLPGVDIDGSGVLALDNGLVGSVVRTGEPSNQSGVALVIPDEDLVTATPIVSLFGVNFGPSTPITVPGGSLFNGFTLEPPGSTWLAAAEVDSDCIGQVPPFANLVPAVIVIP